jgi:hypothetical protein
MYQTEHALLDTKLGLLTDVQRRALTAGADRWLYNGSRGVKRRQE